MGIALSGYNDTFYGGRRSAVRGRRSCYVQTVGITKLIITVQYFTLPQATTITNMTGDRDHLNYCIIYSKVSQS